MSGDVAARGDRRMTVAEISLATGAPVRTVHDAIDRCLPGVKRNGVTTYLTEEQVAAVSAELKRAHTVDLADTRKVVTTDLEMMEQGARFAAWAMGKIREQDAALAAARPRVEAADALMVSEATLSITLAAKAFRLHPRTEVFPYLRTHAYLTADDLPTMAAVEADYLAERMAKLPDGTVRPQAVVLTRQLDVWRTRVVPQIRRWIAEGGAA